MLRFFISMQVCFSLIVIFIFGFSSLNIEGLAPVTSLPRTFSNTLQTSEPSSAPVQECGGEGHGDEEPGNEEPGNEEPGNEEPGNEEPEEEGSVLQSETNPFIADSVSIGSRVPSRNRLCRVKPSIIGVIVVVLLIVVLIIAFNIIVSYFVPVTLSLKVRLNGELLDSISVDSCELSPSWDIVDHNGSYALAMGNNRYELLHPNYYYYDLKTSFPTLDFDCTIRSLIPDCQVYSDIQEDRYLLVSDHRFEVETTENNFVASDRDEDFGRYSYEVAFDVAQDSFVDMNLKMNHFSSMSTYVIKPSSLESSLSYQVNRQGELLFSSTSPFQVEQTEFLGESLGTKESLLVQRVLNGQEYHCLLGYRFDVKRLSFGGTPRAIQYPILCTEIDQEVDYQVNEEGALVMVSSDPFYVFDGQWILARSDADDIFVWDTGYTFQKLTIPKIPQYEQWILSRGEVSIQPNESYICTLVNPRYNMFLLENMAPEKLQWDFVSASQRLYPYQYKQFLLQYYRYVAGINSPRYFDYQQDVLYESGSDVSLITTEDGEVLLESASPMWLWDDSQDTFVLVDQSLGQESYLIDTGGRYETFALDFPIFENTNLRNQYVTFFDEETSVDFALHEDGAIFLNFQGDPICVFEEGRWFLFQDPIETGYTVQTLELPVSDEDYFTAVSIDSIIHVRVSDYHTLSFYGEDPFAISYHGGPMIEAESVFEDDTQYYEYVSDYDVDDLGLSESSLLLDESLSWSPGLKEGLLARYSHDFVDSTHPVESYFRRNDPLYRSEFLSEEDFSLDQITFPFKDEFVRNQRYTSGIIVEGVPPVIPKIHFEIPDSNITSGTDFLGLSHQETDFYMFHERTYPLELRLFDGSFVVDKVLYNRRILAYVLGTVVLICILVGVIVGFVVYRKRRRRIPSPSRLLRMFFEDDYNSLSQSLRIVVNGESGPLVMDCSDRPPPFFASDENNLVVAPEAHLNPPEAHLNPSEARLDPPEYSLDAPVNLWPPPPEYSENNPSLGVHFCPGFLNAEEFKILFSS